MDCKSNAHYSNRLTSNDIRLQTSLLKFVLEREDTDLTDYKCKCNNEILLDVLHYRIF